MDISLLEIAAAQLPSFGQRTFVRNRKKEKEKRGECGDLLSGKTEKIHTKTTKRE